MNERDPISPMASTNQRPLSRAELEFVLRAISDARHALTVLSGMTTTECTVGAVLDEENSAVMEDDDYIAALALAMRLLGWSGPPWPTPLDEIREIRAAIQAIGDSEALRMYDEWRKLYEHWQQLHPIE